MRSIAIVIHSAYFEAQNRMKYAKNLGVNRSGLTWSENLCPWPTSIVCTGDCYWLFVCSVFRCVLVFLRTTETINF